MNNQSEGRERTRSVSENYILIPSRGQFIQNQTMTLSRACEVGDLNQVKLILKHCPVTVNQKNNHERDPLMTICFHGYHSTSFEIATLLLQHGANPTTRDKNGCTSLMDAANGGHSDLAALLIHYGADLNARDNDGTTVLMYACSSGSVEMITMLLSEGAHLHDIDSNGCNSIQYAESSGNCAGNLLSLLTTLQSNPTAFQSSESHSTEEGGEEHSLETRKRKLLVDSSYASVVKMSPTSPSPKTTSYSPSNYTSSYSFSENHVHFHHT